MKHRPLLLFSLVLTLGVIGSVAFIQSGVFTRFAKAALSKYIPVDLGIDFQFDQLAIQYFPPRIVLENPRIKVREKNVLRLPEATELKAQGLEIVFRPFQVFAGQIRVNEIAVKNGEIHINFPKAFFEGTQKKKGKVSFRWDELFRIYAEAFSLQDTYVDLGFEGSNARFSFQADKVRLSQWSSELEVGYESEMRISAFRGQYPKKLPIPEQFDEAEILLRLSPVGLEILNATLRTQSFVLNLSSTTIGNLIADPSLPTTGDVRVEGTLDRIETLFPKNMLPDLKAGGVFRLDSQFEGDLLNMAPTLKMSGKIESTDLKFREWFFEKVVAQGSYSGSGAFPEVQLSSLKLFAKPGARIPPKAFGFGGEVEFKNIQYRFGETERLKTQIFLKDAHPHWLGAPIAKSLFPLDFRMSGSLQAEVQLPGKNRAWSVNVVSDLKLNPFEVDNQTYGKNRLRKKIVDVPQVNVVGPFHVSQDGFKADGLTVSTPGRTRLTLKGGLSSGTLDLNAEGPIDLAEVGHLAEVPIRGAGNMAVHIHGAPSDVIVDFMPQLKETAYINLEYGDIAGKISYHDRDSKLIFQNVQALKGDFAYQTDGAIDLAANRDDISLDIRLHKGNMKNFIAVFDRLTKEFWWIPRELSGQIRGAIQVRGQLDLKKLQATGNVQSAQLEFMGEHFQGVSLKGGFENGDYKIDDFRARKNESSWTGKVSMVDEKELAWSVRSQNLSLEDFDYIASLDFPMRGKMTFSSDGAGTLGQVESRTRITNEGGIVRGRRLDPSYFDVRASKGVFYVNSSVFGGQGTLDLTYDFDARKQSQLRATAVKLDISPLILLLNSKLAEDPTLKAQFSGDLKLQFNAGKAELATGQLEIDQAFSSKADRKIELLRPVRSQLSQGTFDIKDVMLSSDAGKIDAHLSGRDGRISGQMKGPLDLGAIEYLFSSISRARGSLDLDLGVHGTLKEPRVSGKLTLQDGSIRIVNIDNPIESIQSVIEVDGSQIRAQRFVSNFAGGRLTGSGTVGLFIDRIPSLDIGINLSGNKIQMYPFQFAKVRGRLKITGTEFPYLISGDVQVESALSKESFFKKDEGLKAARFTPPASSRSSDFPRFKLDINAEAERNVTLKNEIMDAEIKFKMKAVNTLNVPRVLGSAEIIQGRLMFKDRNFTITQGNAQFDNPTTIDPKFSVAANTQVNDTKINLFASGMKDNFKVDLSSSPAMSGSDILSLLALGVTQDDVRRLRPGAQQSLEQGQAANLVLNSLDFNRDVQDKTGLQIQVEEAINNQTATSVFRPQAQGDTVAAPKIVIKRKIGRRMQLSMGSTVGVGLGRQQELNAEVKVSPAFSVIGVWNQFQGSDTNQNPTSYGLDLKLQKRFK